MRTVDSYRYRYRHPAPAPVAQEPDSKPGPYYVSAVDGPTFWLVSGPYATHAAALAEVDKARTLAESMDRRAVWLAFGTCRCEPGTPAGILQAKASLPCPLP